MAISDALPDAQDGFDTPVAAAAHADISPEAHKAMLAMLLEIYEIEEGPGETDRPHMIRLRGLLRALGELK